MASGAGRLARVAVAARLLGRAHVRHTGTLPRQVTPEVTNRPPPDEERAAARREREEKEPMMAPGGARAYDVIGSERVDRHRVIFGKHGDPSTWAWGHNPAKEFAVSQTEDEGSPTDEGEPETRFALFLSGSHQFKVAVGDVIYLEKIPGDVNSFVKFSEVLLLGSRKWTAVGRPLVTGAEVVAQVEEQTLLAKSYKFVFRKRKKSKRTTGHRQQSTRVRISEIRYDVPSDDNLVLRAPRRQQMLASDLGSRWRTALAKDGE